MPSQSTATAFAVNLRVMGAFTQDEGGHGIALCNLVRRVHVTVAP